MAAHPRNYGKGKFCSEPHQPAGKAPEIPGVDAVPTGFLGTDHRPRHCQAISGAPEIPALPRAGYRSCLGIMSLYLSKKYPHERVETACRRALAIGALSYRSVNSILEKGLDQLPLEDSLVAPEPIRHANLRGPGYYSPKGMLLC